MKKEYNTDRGGFRMPEDYLAGLEDRILGKSIEGSQLAGNPGRELKKHFKVPPSYFDGLEDKITARSRARVIPWPNKGVRIWTLTTAASVALVLGLAHWTADSDVNSWTDLRDRDINGFVNEDYSSFSPADIADAFDDIDLESEIYADMEIEDYLEEIDLENIITEN